jgi:hypothetical protein
MILSPDQAGELFQLLRIPPGAERDAAFDKISTLVGVSAGNAALLLGRMGLPRTAPPEDILRRADCMVYGVAFVVRGSGGFPTELLAKGCWPATLDDARNTRAACTRTINMVSHGQPPAVGDWLAYGWDVLEIGGREDVARALGGYAGEEQPAHTQPKPQLQKLTRTEREILTRISRQDGTILVLQISASGSAAHDRALNALRRMGCVEVVDHPTVHEDNARRYKAPALRLTDVGRVALSSGAVPAPAADGGRDGR